MTDLLARLRGVRACGRDRWVAECQAHYDRDPSLSIARRDGKWLVFCHAGCSVEAITSALKLRVVDLFDDAPSYAHRRTSADAQLWLTSLPVADDLVAVDADGGAA
jgi:hypothetical protein